MTTQALARRSVSPLRALREARRLTQTELARLAGFKGESRSAVRYLETRKPPRWWYRLCRVADTLGVTTDELLGRVPPGPAPVDALARQDRELLDAMRQDAEVLLGPQVLRLAGGWRSLARAAWAGTLYRIREGKLPTGEHVQPSGLPPLLGLPKPPPDWRTGWESRRQRQRMLENGRRTRKALPKPKGG
jgi:transcriptional regulator with XRE-family HTH domain